MARNLIEILEKRSEGTYTSEELKSVDKELHVAIHEFIDGGYSLYTVPQLRIMFCNILYNEPKSSIYSILQKFQSNPLWMGWKKYADL